MSCGGRVTVDAIGGLMMTGWIGMETMSAWLLAAVAAFVGAVLIATGMVDELFHIFRAAAVRPRQPRP